MILLPLFVAIPLGAAFLISLLGKKVRRLSAFLASAATIALAVLSVHSVFVAKAIGIAVYKVGGWIPPIGISMVLDGLSSFMLATVNVLALLITVFSVSYMEQYTAKWKFYTLFMLMLGGMNGVIITGDMFNLFVFLEIASIAGYALVAFGIEREELEASFKYMVMGEMASLFILLGIALLYGLTSTLNMADMARFLSAAGTNKLVLFVSVLFLVGFGLKAAIMPFHAWLPDAHPSAPAPISAMLSGLLIKVLGIYALIRIFSNVLGMSVDILNVLLVLGMVSMVGGAFLATGQDDIKRMLAYSSISQIGYIVLAIGLWTPLAIFAALFHLVNHAVFKSLLFLNSGAIEYSLGTRNLKEMGGLNKRMPLTGATSLIGSMSISGIPPLSGFWSKLLIIFAIIQSGRLGLGLIAVLVSIITLAYYLRLQKYAFLGVLPDNRQQVKEVPFTMKLSMVILALLCITGGALLLPGIREIFLGAAQNAVYMGKAYATVVFEAVK